MAIHRLAQPPEEASDRRGAPAGEGGKPPIYVTLCRWYHVHTLHVWVHTSMPVKSISVGVGIRISISVAYRYVLVAVCVSHTYDIRVYAWIARYASIMHLLMHDSTV